MELATLFKLYAPLMGWVGLGIILGRKLPKEIPLRIGKFLFWIGVPFGIFIFLRQADLSASVWIAPFICWTAILVGAGLAWIWIKGQHYLTRTASSIPSNHSGSMRSSRSEWQCSIARLISPQQLTQKTTQGSFLLSTMFGNTGYLGYPVVLALVGPQYLGWAIFYDTLGSTLGAYGLGVVLAAYFGRTNRLASGNPPPSIASALIKNPAFWSFWVGLAGRNLPLPEAIEQGGRTLAWMVIAVSLLLLGMRLSQLTSWQNVQQAAASLGIKMLLVPLLLGYGLRLLGVSGAPHLVLVLQMAMPPAFATLVIAEVYDLDRDLTVTTLALGSVAILFTLPLWLWLFSP